MALGLLAAKPAHAVANIFTVDRSDDPNLSTTPTAGNCTANTANDCSLRGAITKANTTANAGADTIEFDIPGGGVHTIAPTTSLPTIVDPVTINGYSEDGATPNTLPLPTQGTNATPTVVLDGANTIQFGFKLETAAAGSVIKGIIFSRFSFQGILIDDTDDVVIEGNFFGTNAAGTVGQGNGFQGIQLRQIIGPADGVRIGGPLPAHRNLIADNDAQGIELDGATNVVIQGNLIGTDKTGTANLGNSQGINLNDGAKNATIGGTTAEAGNVIAFSTNQGVALNSDTGNGNSILRNSIFANGDQGIALFGGNRGQAAPVVTLATTASGSTTIKGKLKSTKNAQFIIQVFSTSPGQGDDEGKVFLGQKTVTTNDKGNAKFTLTIAGTVNPGFLVTGTATNKQKRDSSEFSPAETVVAG
jgi:hypothetical protein